MTAAGTWRDKTNKEKIVEGKERIIRKNYGVIDELKKRAFYGKTKGE